MSNEYVRLSSDEMIYAKKTLLSTQLESLTSLKKLQEFKELRNTELTLKISIKTSLDSLQQQLIILDKLLPHSSWKKPKDEEMLPSIHTSDYFESPALSQDEPLNIKKQEREMKKKEKENSIESQLAEIRNKLNRLS